MGILRSDGVPIQLGRVDLDSQAWPIRQGNPAFGYLEWPGQNIVGQSVVAGVVRPGKGRRGRGNMEDGGRFQTQVVRTVHQAVDIEGRRSGRHLHDSENSPRRYGIGHQVVGRPVYEELDDAGR